MLDKAIYALGCFAPSVKKEIWSCPLTRIRPVECMKGANWASMGGVSTRLE